MVVQCVTLLPHISRTGVWVSLWLHACCFPCHCGVPPLQWIGVTKLPKRVHVCVKGVWDGSLSWVVPCLIPTASELGSWLQMTLNKTNSYRRWMDGIYLDRKDLISFNITWNEAYVQSRLQFCQTPFASVHVWHWNSCQCAFQCVFPPSLVLDNSSSQQQRGEPKEAEASTGTMFTDRWKEVINIPQTMRSAAWVPLKCLTPPTQSPGVSLRQPALPVHHTIYIWPSGKRRRQTNMRVIPLRARPEVFILLKAVSWGCN